MFSICGKKFLKKLYPYFSRKTGFKKITDRDFLGCRRSVVKRKEKMTELTFDPTRDIDWQLLDVLSKIGQEIVVLKKLSLAITEVSSH